MDGASRDESKGLVCKLLRALDGLKQSPHQRHVNNDELIMGELGFQSSFSDPCLYSMEKPGGGVMAVTLYVDDLLLAGSDNVSIRWIKSELKKRFDIKDLGEAHVCLGLEIERDRSNLLLNLRPV